MQRVDSIGNIGISEFNGRAETRGDRVESYI